MKINELKILHNGRCSDVVCYRPDGLDKYPVVIFSHGYNGHKSDFEISAKYFARMESGLCAIHSVVEVHAMRVDLEHGT